jgi:N-acyl-D-aspartate/D-glutamate deacylase
MNRSPVFARLIKALVVSGLLALDASAAAADQPVAERRYDVVLQQGRVIDPESGLDDIRSVGIEGDRITAISVEPLHGVIEIDATSLVVAPGFIDLHNHSPTPLGQSFQVRDGVTTALELEAGAYPLADYGRLIREEPLINYGASAGYASIRANVKLGIHRPDLLLDKSRPVGLLGYWTALRSIFVEPMELFTEPPTPKQRARFKETLREALDNGGIGIGLALDYMSEAVDEEEVRGVFEVAGERQVPVFVHVRRGVNGDPTGLREVISAAREAGAPLHICHIPNNAMGNIELFLEEIRNARAMGLDVTTELLPYTAGAAPISAAVFGRDWQTIFDIDYEDVEWTITGERFNEAMWNEYREKYPEGIVAHHYLDEAWIRRALVEPGVMVVSDLIAMVDRETNVPPHNGAFAKVLGRYVREEGLLDLRTALAKMTLLPAQRLEKTAPLFRKKGRLQVGADADITVFDPAIVIDRATYADAYQASTGIIHVLVNGVPVVRDEAVQPDVYPGRVLAAPKTAR